MKIINKIIKLFNTPLDFSVIYNTRKKNKMKIINKIIKLFNTPLDLSFIYNTKKKAFKKRCDKLFVEQMSYKHMRKTYWEIVQRRPSDIYEARFLYPDRQKKSRNDLVAKMTIFQKIYFYGYMRLAYWWFDLPLDPREWKRPKWLRWVPIKEKYKKR